MLMTETPRPHLGDPTSTEYADTMEDATVIDATQIASLLIEMTSFSQEVREDFEDFGGDNYAWQIAQFFNFDYSALSNIAPPFESMALEFDTRQAIEDLAKRDGKTLDPKTIVNVGKTVVQMVAFPAEAFKDVAKRVIRESDRDDETLARISMDTDLGWVLSLSPYHYVPGKGMVGPMCNYLVPVKADGTPYLDQQARNPLDRTDDRLGLWATMSPPKPRDRYDAEDGLPQRSAAAQGWQSIIPALLAINFMHTPQGERGYHKRVVEQPDRRLGKKFLAKHFRPLTSWHVLDISPLREAVMEANGGSMPGSMAGLVKALHIVRGHYAHYPPNTYFGRKHEEWITVFRPSFRRGDIKAGRVDKDYRVEAL